MRLSCCFAFAAALLTLNVGPVCADEASPPRTFDGYYVLHDFHFASGETLPET